MTSELVHVRADAGDFWLAEIGHYIYVGDTGSPRCTAQQREIVDLLGVAHLPTHP